MQTQGPIQPRPQQCPVCGGSVPLGERGAALTPERAAKVLPTARAAVWGSQGSGRPFSAHHPSFRAAPRSPCSPSRDGDPTAPCAVCANASPLSGHGGGVGLLAVGWVAEIIPVLFSTVIPPTQPLSCDTVPVLVSGEECRAVINSCKESLCSFQAWSRQCLNAMDPSRAAQAVLAAH